MELIRVIPSESKLWEQVWRLYTESFPDYERRRISSHSRACEDPAFHTYIAVDNGNLLALIFYWKDDKFIYIEHIAVNPNMRGRNIGTTLLKDFIADNKGTDVILEIDPPQDDISRKRLSFYEKVGFRHNEHVFNHPSYTKNGKAHQLHIMSYPEEICLDKFEKFKEFVTAKVLSYID